MSWELIVSLAIAVPAIVGLLVLLVRLRRQVRVENELRRRPFGQLVTVAPGCNCGLCGVPLSAEATELAGLRICQMCSVGEFAGRLDSRGVRIQDVRMLCYSHNVDGGTQGSSRTIDGYIHQSTNIRATFFRKGGSDAAIFNALSLGMDSKLRTEYPDFDDEVSIRVKAAPEALAALLRHAGLREAIRQTVAQAFFSLEGNKLTFQVTNDAPQRRGRLRCCTALVLHNLMQALAQGAVPTSNVGIETPNLSSSLQYAPTAISRLFISHSTIDDLRDVLAAHDSQRSHEPMTGLWLSNVVVRGSLAPLAEMKSLTFLAFENAFGLSDLAPIGALSRLEELTLERCAVSDVTPLASLSNLKELSLEGSPIVSVRPLGALVGLRLLNLRGTQVSDVSPLASLTALEVLRTSGAPIPAEHMQRLRAALPTVAIDTY